MKAYTARDFTRDFPRNISMPYCLAYMADKFGFDQIHKLRSFCRRVGVKIRKNAAKWEYLTREDAGRIYEELVKESRTVQA